jgi:hypothetical protein
MVSVERPTARAFVTEWIDLHVLPHPFPDDLGSAIAGLVEQCIAEAAVLGISAADIADETGYDVTGLILAAFLLRWNPETGDGGFA